MLPKMLQVVTTTDSLDQARRIAEQLIEQRLAACVQIEGPLTSVYRWQGELETADEYRLAIKTLATAWDRVASEIKRLHSYEVPEIIALPVEHVNEAYHLWIVDEHDV